MDQKTIITQKLLKAGLRATSKRQAIGALLFDGENKHVTAEDVCAMAREADLKVSQATVYNTLNQFVEAGLLKRIIAGPEKAWFDTNTSDHHHIFDEDALELTDIPADDIAISGLPDFEAGRVKGVELMVRVSDLKS